ncbi:hypothetical protein SAICODRAFT_64505 [Saitoella complicata NRRL Y-17804]|uniref:uncharacterized protein n=1 Tax=Saitoella complicata (strain BCRC 22490 / CBS 7301 / JCM 7358 / NBRC 10748 / NRRL Y-17804) TaxID=698492 RepID=UPI000866D9B6|nr:uncharacterized protein SAICODRAFT_64505 [Saitoella complicata NRRL Y-17804]ODQ54739.1 hypothetical protein SAICODRAFT_64505 [Saitoella complicata NRRL Y-17804]
MAEEYRVNVGASILDPGRPEASPFFAVHHRFIPTSADNIRPSRLHGGPEHYDLEIPGRNGKESQSFEGTREAQNDVDCVLIYNEETGEYTLERLDSILHMNHVRGARASSKDRRPASPPTSSELESRSRTTTSGSSTNRHESQERQPQRMQSRSSDQPRTTTFSSILTKVDKPAPKPTTPVPSQQRTEPPAKAPAPPPVLQQPLMLPTATGSSVSPEHKQRKPRPRSPSPESDADDSDTEIRPQPQPPSQSRLGRIPQTIDLGDLHLDKPSEPKPTAAEPKAADNYRNDMEDEIDFELDDLADLANELEESLDEDKGKDEAASPADSMQSAARNPVSMRSLAGARREDDELPDSDEE